jgi:hypothetical protein
LIVGLLAVVATYPLDVLRARMAFRFGNGRQYFLLPELRTFFAQYSSFSTLYRGFIPTALGMSIYSGSSFFVFDTLDQLLKDVLETHPGLSKFLCGFVAGILAQTVSYPFDVLRRRMQIYHIAPHLQTDKYDLKGLALSIYYKEGLAAFWRGLSVNFLKVAPATGISFYCYNLMRNMIERS